MKLFSQLCRRAALLVPVLAMLLGSSIAWGQFQTLETVKIHDIDQLLLWDVELNTVTHDNEGDVARDFKDIAYLPTLDLLAIDGDEVWWYSGGAFPAEPNPPINPDPRVPPQSILTASEIGLRSISTIAADATTGLFMVWGQAKGKPVFHANLCELIEVNGDISASCELKAKEFPRPVAADDVPKRATGDLQGGGFVMTGGKEIVFHAAADDYIDSQTIVTKRGVLDGNEAFTDVAWLSDDILVVGTSHRKLLTIDLSSGDTTVIDEEGTGAPSCTSDKQQIMSVEASADDDETVIVSADFACSVLTAYDGNGVEIATLDLDVMPEGIAAVDGQFLDLNGCVNDPNGCSLHPEGTAPVSLTSLTGPSGAVVRQAVGMRDLRCSYLEDDGITINGATRPPDSALDWNDILPQEVVDLGIVQKPTWISPMTQGDPDSKCEVGAFIVATDPDTKTGIIEGFWEVDEFLEPLLDTRCETSLPRSNEPDIDEILDWDVVIYAPTRGLTVCPDCPAGIGFETMLASNACGSSGFRGRGFSIIGYGFSIPSGEDPQALVHVTDQLITDLGTAIDELAQPLLSLSQYMTLKHRYDLVLSKWTTAKDKFVNQPNAADTALGALISQLGNLREENQVAEYQSDFNNIQGEIEVRVDVAIFVIDERLRQSVPLNGF